jgi:hypothetical protein
VWSYKEYVIDISPSNEWRGRRCHDHIVVGVIQHWLVWLGLWNATLNNISAISWQSVLLVEETGENHKPAGSH